MKKRINYGEITAILEINDKNINQNQIDKIYTEFIKLFEINENLKREKVNTKRNRIFKKFKNIYKQINKLLANFNKYISLNDCINADSLIRLDPEKDRIIYKIPIFIYYCNSEKNVTYFRIIKND